MEQQDLQKAVKHQYHSLTALLQNMNSGFSINWIHKFRLEYKKLRAILKSISTTGFVFSIPGKLKKAYHISGKIRDIQLLIKRLENTGQKNSKCNLFIIKLLHNSLEINKQILSHLLSKKMLKKCRKKTIDELPEDFHFEGVHQFAKQEWEQLDNILHYKYFSDNRLHQLRTGLKNMTLADTVFEKYQAANNLEIIKPWKVPAVALLVERLGDYQDQCASISILKALDIADFSVTEKMELAYKKKTFVSQKLQMKKSLIEDIKAVNKMVPTYS